MTPDDMIHCNDCYAYYSKDYNHVCPPWMKMLVQRVRDMKSEKPYHEIDHSHCWDQGREPACGLPKKTHKICCLCAIPKRVKKGLYNENEEI